MTRRYYCPTCGIRALSIAGVLQHATKTHRLPPLYALTCIERRNDPQAVSNR